MNKYSQIKTYFPIIVWPALVFAIHLLSQELGFYNKITWLDTPMHFIGGMAIAAGSYSIFSHLEKKNELKTNSIVKIFLAISITALAAVLWEFSEYISDSILHSHMQSSIYDTMKDLNMGLLGAIAVSLFKNRKP